MIIGTGMDRAAGRARRGTNGGWAPIWRYPTGLCLHYGSSPYILQKMWYAIRTIARKERVKLCGVYIIVQNVSRTEHVGRNASFENNLQIGGGQCNQ